MARNENSYSGASSVDATFWEPVEGATKVPTGATSTTLPERHVASVTGIIAFAPSTVT